MGPDTKKVIDLATETKQDDIISNQTDGSQKTKLTDGTTDVMVSDEGQLHVVLMGMIDTNNSTINILNADDIFTGLKTETLNFGFIFVTVFSDVASATDGLSVEQSSDGINWDNLDVYTIPANKGKTYSFQPAAKFFRIVYTNGGTGQSAFRLQTIMKKTSSLPSSHRIQDAIVDDDDAELVKAVVTGRNPGGSFVNFQATNGGNFKISLEELENAISVNSNTQLKSTLFDSNGSEVLGEVQQSPTINTVLARLQKLSMLEISQGNISGFSFWHKFGMNESIGTSWETVWGSGGLYLFPSSASIMKVSSTNNNDASGGTGLRTVTIIGLDGDYVEVEETVVLNGQTEVNTSTSFLRINRLIGKSAGSTGENQGIIYIGTGTVTAGVPDNIFGSIDVVNSQGNNQSLMGVLTIPADKTGYLMDIYYSTSEGKSTQGSLFIRPFGEIFQAKTHVEVFEVNYSHPYTPPLPVTEKSDIDVRAVSSAAGTHVATEFNLILIDN